MTRSASAGASFGEPAADLHPGGVHPAAGDRGVRPGQVDVLEQAALGLGVGEPGRAQPVLVDGQQLARLDLAHERRADDVQRGGLARHHPAALEPAEHERAHAVRVARGVERGLVREHQAERAAHGRQQLQRGLLDAAVGGLGREQPAEQVGVGGGAVVGAQAGRARPGRAARRCSPGCRCGRGTSPLPMAVLRNVGWAFSQVVEPVVEYRQCPTATWPRSDDSVCSSKTWLTRPRSLNTTICRPSDTEMPAASWPRCCSA